MEFISPRIPGEIYNHEKNHFVRRSHCGFGPVDGPVWKKDCTATSSTTTATSFSSGPTATASAACSEIHAPCNCTRCATTATTAAATSQTFQKTDSAVVHYF